MIRSFSDESVKFFQAFFPGLVGNGKTGLLPMVRVLRRVHEFLLRLLTYPFLIEVNAAIGDVAHTKRRGLTGPRLMVMKRLHP
jgi:hypothetical protein